MSLVVMLLCALLTGCKDQSEASQVLPAMEKYFPGTVIYKFDKRVLWIQTNVDGISGEMAMQIYKDSCQQAATSIGQIKINVVEELQFDGRSILIIGFKHGVVACDLRNGADRNGVPVGQVMNWQIAKAWLTQHIGYVPTPDKIEVVTEEAARNTPKGQTMQLQTLAQVQAANREKQQEQMQDLLRQQEVLKN